MYKLRSKRMSRTPEMPISPMIDMIFLLLVFFILSTMHMTQVKTVSVKLPVAKNTVVQKKTTLNVAIKADNSLWLEDKATSLDMLVIHARRESEENAKVAVVIRADQKAAYGTVIALMDKLKGAGITQFGMAADAGMK